MVFFIPAPTVFNTINLQNVLQGLVKFSQDTLRFQVIGSGLESLNTQLKHMICYISIDVKVDP